MKINWTSVESQIEQAVADVVGTAWRNVAEGASTQFAAIIAAGKQIEQKKDSMKQEEYNSLKLMQQRALEGVLQSYAGIALDVAARAALAAWNVVAAALRTTYPFLVFL